MDTTQMYNCVKTEKWNFRKKIRHGCEKTKQKILNNTNYYLHNYYLLTTYIQHTILLTVPEIKMY